MSFILTSTDIKDGQGIIQDKYELYQNYPNPFNPSTKIQFKLPESSMVELSIIDVNGGLVKKIINKYMTAGSYSINFEASDLSSGIYFYQLKTEKFTDIRKMVLMK